MRMPWNNLHEYIKAFLQIHEKNNRMVIQKAHYFLLCIVQENVFDNGRVILRYTLLQNSDYIIDYFMTDEDLN